MRKRELRKAGEAIGLIPVLGSMALAIGYTVVMGWIFKYTAGVFTGSALEPADIDGFSSAFGGMASSFGNNGWQMAALAAAIAILMFGIGGGIEKVNKILMPLFFFLFFGAGGYTLHFSRGQYRDIAIFSALIRRPFSTLR